MKVDFIILNNYDRNGDSWVSVGYLHSAIKYDFDSQVVFFVKDETDAVLDWVLDRKPDIIGLPVLQYNFWYVLELCEKIKMIRNDIFIFLGNKDAMYYSQYIMSNYECINAIIVGEGEDTLLEMCNRLSMKLSLNGCKGVIYREKDKVIYNDFRTLRENIDEFPFPSRDYRAGDSNTFNVIGSRGCVGKCSFCEANTTYKYHPKSLVRYRTIGNILDEIECLTQKYGYIHVNFLDSAFCCNNSDAIARLNDFYVGIVDRGLDFEFGFNARAEQITDSYIEKLIQLGKVGLSSILVGFETGNTKDITLYGKRADLSKNKEAIRLLNKYGILSGREKIAFETGFINFNPYSTVEGIYDNICFFRDNNLYLFPYDVLSRLMVSGSAEISKKIADDGLILGDPKRPITDPYMYKFKNSEIEVIYTLYCNIFSEVKINYFSNFLAILKRYEVLFGLTDEKNILDKYIGYKQLVSEFVSSISFDVLNCFEQRKEPLEYINKYKDLLCAFTDEGRELMKLQNRMAINLKIKNSLIVE